ncbi:hypothetical protein SAMN05421640_0196 [Ekhidna lutea]|uniref:Uncharacterized protein n=1 Tax=Ekhidna lutea TaxID=447679 RepID=A0A239ELZ0_EKHLU|nr:hypothetical protein [Ekhidna lutea]SNS45053.1 hypothetical protein SAMN05421640_0196 [Ekhidna lutea]
MRKVIIVLFFWILIIGCGNSDCISASCIAPPEGTFNSSEYNIAIFPLIESTGNQQARTQSDRMDSVIVHSDQDIVVREFYTWVAIPKPENVTSFTLYVGEDSFEVSGFLPSLTEDLKGYLIGFLNEDESIKMVGEQASEDLINGVCNDTINC